MKLEAVDPLNLDTICEATVVRVLNHGYLMVRVDRCVTPAADVVQEADEDDDAQPHDPLVGSPFLLAAFGPFLDS